MTDFVLDKKNLPVNRGGFNIDSGLILDLANWSWKLYVDCYECHFNINMLENTVSSVTLKGNYIQTSLTVDPTLVYDLDFDTRYADISYPKNDFGSRVQKDKDELKVFLQHKGTSKDRLTIVVRNYDGSFKISH